MCYRFSKYAITIEVCMIRTQIQLAEEQALTLKTIATEKHKRAVAAAGRFHSDKSNLSAKHDKYLAEAYEK